MTGAERKARYRAARAAGAPVAHTRRPTDRRSRVQRWNDTIAAVELQAEYLLRTNLPSPRNQEAMARIPNPGSAQLARD
jgi:hypothetical protein